MPAITPPKPKSYRLTATKEIIAGSLPNDSRHCVLEETIRVRIAGAYSVQVTSEVTRFNVGEWRFYYPTPPNAAAIAARFDDTGKRPRPFKFMLNARSCMGVKAVIRTGPKPAPDPTKKKRKETAAPKRSGKRRYHGLKVIVVKA